MKKQIMTMVLTAGLLVCSNSSVNAGFMDTLNSVSNTLDTVNSTVDRTQRTYDRFKNTTTQTSNSTTTTVKTANQENNMTNNQSLLNSYLNKNNKFFINYDFPTSVSSIAVTSMLASQNDGVHSSVDIPMDAVKGRVELPWYNGNYIVWNTGMSNTVYYSAEYNSEKNEAGFVVIVEPNGGTNFYTCFEYTKSNYDKHELLLRSILIYHKDSHRAAFLYDANKNLIMYQIDGASKIERPSLIKNSQFMSEIATIFDNPILEKMY